MGPHAIYARSEQLGGVEVSRSARGTISKFQFALLEWATRRNRCVKIFLGQWCSQSFQHAVSLPKQQCGIGEHGSQMIKSNSPGSILSTACLDSQDGQALLRELSSLLLSFLTSLSCYPPEPAGGKKRPESI